MMMITCLLTVGCDLKTFQISGSVSVTQPHSDTSPVENTETIPDDRTTTP